MEYAVYKVFVEDGRKKGSFVNMLATRQEAEIFAQRQQGEHEIVTLWTREISEEDEHLWNIVLFDEEGSLQPVG